MSKETLAVFLILVASLPGCKPQPEIESYRVPRSNTPQEPVDAEEVASQFDRILVAIVPHKDKAWFFKLTGSASAIDRQRDAFYEFLETVTVDDSSDGPPAWQTPEGWDERPASQMRAATLIVPDEAGPLELSVSSLPLADDWAKFLSMNVNRWMGQLGQPSLDDATIAELIKEVPVEGETATVIELAGIMNEPAMGSNPHSSGATDVQQESSPSEPPANEQLTYESPEGWLPGRLSAMRKAAFRLVEGNAEAEVTIIDLPIGAGSQVADVEANLRRWAGEVGLTDLDSGALEELAQPINIDGIEGVYAELTSPGDAEPAQSTLVAMVVRRDKVWFIKMFGESSLVKGQQEAFRTFLGSIKFK